jgi:L-2-hydroxyglutarate oxidase LhgO
VSENLRDIDVAVVGAGVVGLAAAAALASAGRSVLILERNDAIALETTTRNSEVIHAGIYYPKDSLKAQLCVSGRRALVQRCAERGIPHRLLGKLIVATNPEELELLDDLQTRGIANDVEQLELVNRDEALRLEPSLSVVGALSSPVSGIVDGHSLSLSYQAEAEAGGAVVALGHRVETLALNAGLWSLEVSTPDGERQTLRSAAVVNAAGLAGDRIAELAGIDLDASGYRLRLCKGDYFSLSAGVPLRFSHLVYPVPAGPGLGIHATVDLGGRIRFGPDAHYVDDLDYAVEAAKASDFAEAIRRYVPSMQSDWLAPDYAGIRPKLSGPGEAFRDFVIAEESGRGCPGLVNCIGIESPGLTASPAIGQRVAELLASL